MSYFIAWFDAGTNEYAGLDDNSFDALELAEAAIERRWEEACRVIGHGRDLYGEAFESDCFANARAAARQL
jgi:hypothetical protein